jgi:hypothetical protein
MGFPFVWEFSKLVMSGVPASNARLSRREIFTLLFLVFTVNEMINWKRGYRILGRRTARAARQAWPSRG